MIQELLPAALRQQIPAIRSQEGAEDPMVYVKLFMPAGNKTWFITEFDAEDKDTLFGVIYDDADSEWGYFSLSELQGTEQELSLQNVRSIGPDRKIILPQAVERDESFTPKPLSQARAEYETRFAQSAAHQADELPSGKVRQLRKQPQPEGDVKLIKECIINFVKAMKPVLEPLVDEMAKFDVIRVSRETRILHITRFPDFPLPLYRVEYLCFGVLLNALIYCDSKTGKSHIFEEISVPFETEGKENLL